MKPALPFILLIISLFSCSTFAEGKHESLIQQAVDAYVEKFQAKEHFTGMAVSVFLPEKKGVEKGNIYSYFSGMVQVPPPKRPVTAENLFEIGSITKSYASVVLLQLEGERKLSLDDPLGKWLPQYKQWAKVTLRQLLSMTSGIPNYTVSDKLITLIETNPSKVWTDESILAYATPDKPIPDAEKAGFDYSNSNYVLAGMVIEKVTGQTFGTAIDARILKPFGLKNTFYPPAMDKAVFDKKILPRMMHGYTFDEKTGKLINLFGNNLSWAVAAGAIVADTVDILRYVQLLYQGRLFESTYREKALKALETSVSMSTGKPIKRVDSKNPKGFGLGIGYYYDKAIDNRFFVYEGSTLGFRVFYLYSPCNQIITVGALNSKAGEGNPTSIQGDHLMRFNLDLYENLIKQEPALACKN